MRYEVVRPNGESEGLLADEWEIHESGALLFYSSHGKFQRQFELAYAPGAWASFFGADA